MDKENAFEIRRHIFHICLGLFFILAISLGADWRFFMAALILGVPLSFAARKRKVPIISWFLSKFERKSAWPGKGAIFFVIGTLAVVLLFRKDIVLASIMILTFGDSLAHLFGRFFGRIKHPWNDYKMLEGTVIGFAAGAIAAAFFVPWLQAITASAAAMVIESYEVKFRNNYVDDNLLVPLVAGIVLWLFRSWINVPV